MLHIIILLVFVIPATIHAQDQEGRIEAFLAIGRHVVLNENYRNLQDNKRYLAGQVLYNFSETQSFGVRYGNADYGIGIIEWFATYRHNWRKRQPTRIYFGVGLGASESIEGVDMRFSMTFAIGVKRFVGNHWSMSLESRGVGFTQRKSEDTHGVMAINELTFALGYLF